MKTTTEGPATAGCVYTPTGSTADRCGAGRLGRSYYCPFHALLVAGAADPHAEAEKETEDA